MNVNIYVEIVNKIKDPDICLLYCVGNQHNIKGIPVVLQERDFVTFVFPQEDKGEVKNENKNKSSS